jgi:plasmid stability protein
MPTLIVDDMPTEVYEHLRRRADAQRRSIGEEAIALLEQALAQEASPRLPDFVPAAEVMPPCELPRPAAAVVPYVEGLPRLPDPLV